MGKLDRDLVFYIIFRFFYLNFNFKGSQHSFVVNLQLFEKIQKHQSSGSLAIFGKTVLATLFNTVPSGGQKIVFLQIILVNQVSKHLSFHLRPLVLS